MNITFNGFSLQDSTYITKTVNYRTRAPRKLQSEVISRRLGKKLINTQIQEKIITLQGIIVTDTVSDLQDAVDDLQQNLTEAEGDLIIDSGRTYVATVSKLLIPDRSYNQTTVDFDIEFISTRPFSTSSQHSPGFTIPSGVSSLSITTTLSGTVENRPTISFTLASGDANVTAIKITNQATGNDVTVSGAFNSKNEVVFNYDDFNILVDGVDRDYVGFFDSIEPGSNTLDIVVSGVNCGTDGLLSYSPRYW